VQADNPNLAFGRRFGERAKPIRKKLCKDNPEKEMTIVKKRFFPSLNT
jgi:hypothetical protein